MNGLIALLGSGEYLPVMNKVDEHLLASVNTNGRRPRVICLPTAAGQEGDQSIDRWSGMGIAHFQQLGADASAPRIIDRQSADDPQWEAALESADLIYFSGGNPMYLYETVQGSRAWKAAQKAWQRGAVFAGCSAGAMILGQMMPNFRYAGLQSMSGFGILPPAYIVPHFDRMRGLWSVLLFSLRRRLKMGETILGIEENTALIGTINGEWTVMGQGKVYLLTAANSQVHSPGDTLSLYR